MSDAIELPASFLNVDPRMHEKLFGQVWYVTRAAYEALIMSRRDVHAQRAGPEKDANGVNARRPMRDAWGDDIAQSRMIDQVAVVPVFGPLMKGATGYDKYYGVAAYEDIHEDLSGARERGARAVVLHVCSPGGTVTGCHGVAEHVAELRKGGLPVYSYTEDMMCSAAEYITGACTGRFATVDAIVGSIGTMMTVVTFEKYLSRMGVEFNIFASGKFKGMHPGKDLTTDQKDFLQKFVNARAEEFKAHMVQYREGIKPETMQGQFFTGKEAAKNGLIDLNVRNLGEVIELI